METDNDVLYPVLAVMGINQVLDSSNSDNEDHMQGEEGNDGQNNDDY